jgi:predicted metal-dependent phosphoesterase TrpH
MVGEMHCHTFLSLPRWAHAKLPSPHELVDYAISIGLDFVAITDHDSQEAFGVVHAYAKERGLVVIPAIEVSTKSSRILRRRSHVLAYGVTEQITSHMTLEETVARVHAGGGFAVAAHPYCISYARALYIGDKAKKVDFDGVEVFNSFETETANAKSLKLATDMKVLGLCGSDAHNLASLGLSRVKVHIPKTDNWREIVHALRKGQFELHQKSYGERASSSFTAMRKSLVHSVSNPFRAHK